jgi:cobalamin biosynthesis protein CobD/CbiB
MDETHLTILYCSLVWSVLAFIAAFFALLDVWAFKRSTHRIQYVPPVRSTDDLEARREALREMKRRAEDPDYRYEDPFYQGE